MISPKKDRNIGIRLKYLALITAAIALPTLASSQASISINVQSGRHAINPYIYGISNYTQAQLQDLNAPLVRYGGDSSSTYNWLLNADNRGNDWYFESIGDTSAVAGERGDTFIQGAKLASSQPMLTIPMLPFVANLGANRTDLMSFSVHKYGAQVEVDPYNPAAGNGVSAKGKHPYIVTNNPLDANVKSSANAQLAWIQHLITKWGKSLNGGLTYYILDNEPSLWHSTHRDIHPVGETMTEIYNDYVAYAGNIRTSDPNAMIVGPEEWGWDGYFYSGFDQQFGADHGWGGALPDRTAHGNMDYIPWLLQQLSAYKKSTGKQLLNVLSLHYYPQQGEYSTTDTAAMQLIRNRSTRSLWDPTYTDTSWINSKVELIPRMKSWVSTYFPGLLTAITEYNWGDEEKMNGATAQADILGIFGVQALDMATRWGTPATNSPTYLAMKMYRNYDGLDSCFGDTSVSCTVPNPDTLSAFASQRTSDGALTVMVINKATTAAPAKISIANFTSTGIALAYQISSPTQTSITYLGNASVVNGIMNETLPAQSITLFVLPEVSTGPQYDFETGVQGWTFNGAPITSVTQSTAEFFTGKHSLAVNFNGSAGTANAYVSSPTTPAGSSLTFHIWIPAGSSISSIQPYVLQSALGGWTYTSVYEPIGNLVIGGWSTIIVDVPTNAVTPLYQIGVQFTTTSAWTGTCYIDAVEW